MIYVVCGDSALKKTVSFGNPDYTCYVNHGKEAFWRRYDSRNSA